MKKRNTYQVTPEYIRELKLKDFLGELDPYEVEIAKDHGVYEWDTWAKNRRQNQG